MQAFRGRILLIAACLVSACGVGGAAADATPIALLEDDALSMEVTPKFGGRVLGFHLKGYDNIIKVGAAVDEIPNPDVNHETDNIGYLGHTVWLGPQSEWWLHQTANPERKAKKATWPPDPYLAFAETAVLERKPSKLVLEGVRSPVSGVQLRKTFQLLETDANAAQLSVTATNIRDEKVAWGIWFNTRLDSSSRVYVPLASGEDLRIEQWADHNNGPIIYSMADGFFSLDLADPPEGKVGRQGKAFIQPSEGWLAAFGKQQLFIITFPLKPASDIHPEQGQVELYLNHRPGSEDSGLLEMEVHAPYRELPPGASMSAHERWYLFPYHGQNIRDAHVAFLKQTLARIFPQDTPPVTGTADQAQ